MIDWLAGCSTALLFFSPPRNIGCCAGFIMHESLTLFFSEKGFFFSLSLSPVFFLPAAAPDTFLYPAECALYGCFIDRSTKARLLFLPVDTRARYRENTHYNKNGRVDAFPSLSLSLFFDDAEKKIEIIFPHFTFSDRAVIIASGRGERKK